MVISKPLVCYAVLVLPLNATPCSIEVSFEAEIAKAISMSSLRIQSKRGDLSSSYVVKAFEMLITSSEGNCDC